MPQFTERRLAHAHSLRDELAPSGALTRDQARLFSQAVRLGWQGTGLSMWTSERRTKQINDAHRLLEMAAVCNDLGDKENAEALWRRAGDIFEWLKRSESHTSLEEGVSIPLALLGAAAFHLAGLPAMAASLLRDNPQTQTGTIFAAFLRADFVGTINAATQFWSENQALTRPVAECPQSLDNPKFLGIEAVRSIGLIAAALRTRQGERLNHALTRLRALAQLARHSQIEYLWLMMELTAQVADKFSKQSMWNGIAPLEHRMSPEGRDRLDAYVRAMFINGRGLLWPSQQEGVSRLAQGGSFALCTPTGSGKTTIAELALLDALYSETAPTSPLAIYLVPSRALAAEVEARLASSIGRADPQLTITSLYGGTEWSLSDAWVTADGPTILVSTVEMAEALMRHLGALLIPRIALVVVDEAHQVQFIDSPQNKESLRRADHRSARLEQFLMRIFACAPQCRALALSAVAGGVETTISRWMSRDENAEATGSPYRSTRQLIGALECRANNAVSVRLEQLDGGNLHLADSEDATAYIPTPFPAMPAVAGPFRSSMSRFARAHSFWAAVQIARSGRTTLISVTRDMDQVITDFRTLLEGAWREENINLVRTTDDDIFSACVAACEDYCGSNSNELFLLRRGVAVHHGQLPMRVRRLMTDVIRNGTAPIVVATSTLTEGVNLPFDVVILPSILRSQFVGYNPDGTPEYDWAVLSASEFLNLAGRAGRPGTMGEGLTLVALPIDPTSRPNTQARRTQQATIRKHTARFTELLESLQPNATGSIEPKSPIAELLNLLYASWREMTPLGSDAQFLIWLETANHPDESPPLPVGAAMDAAMDAAEALDSVDLVLLAAIQEIEARRGMPLTSTELEAHLKYVWSCSFAKFASSEQARLGSFFVKRGCVLPQNMYPEAARRRRLYSLGLPPKQGLAFLQTATRIEEQLRRLDEFSRWSHEERFLFIKGLADLSQETPGFRFRTDGNWSEILRWWLQVPGARQPRADEVQSWLRTATGDFEYRLGTAISTVLSSIWNQTMGDSLESPTREEWKNATGLPWPAIWIRELLAWGTLEPLVAYLMATNRAATRSEAQSRLPEYLAWLQDRDGGLNQEDIYHPQRLHEWASLAEPQDDLESDVQRDVPAVVIGQFPPAPLSYPVVSLVAGDKVHWLDPSGYVLAESRYADMPAHFANYQRCLFTPSANQVSLVTW